MMKSYYKQEGAALAVGLILLVILTLLGYTSMKGTMLQEKMAAGLHNRSLAQGGSNSALRSGEDFLYHLVENTNGVDVDGTPGGDFFGIYSHYQDAGDSSSGLNTTVQDFLKRNRSSGAGTAHDFIFSALTSNAKLVNNPEYIIEHVTLASGGVGGSGGTTVEFGAGAGSSSGGAGDGSIQKVFLVSGKSQSGDGKTYAINQSMYTVVVSSQPTN